MTNPLREKIARIVDPEAFENFEKGYFRTRTDGSLVPMEEYASIVAAPAKADLILGVEGLEGSSCAEPQPGSVAATWPDGWSLVPIAPTEAMKAAVREHGGAQGLAWALAAWPCMLSAAPPPPATPADEGSR